jgi:hypothetical protein
MQDTMADSSGGELFVCALKRLPGTLGYGGDSQCGAVATSASKDPVVLAAKAPYKKTMTLREVRRHNLARCKREGTTLCGSDAEQVY